MKYFSSAQRAQTQLKKISETKKQLTGQKVWFVSGVNLCQISGALCVFFFPNLVTRSSKLISYRMSASLLIRA